LKVSKLFDEKRKKPNKTGAREQLRVTENRFEALLSASSEVLYRMSPDWSEMRQQSQLGTMLGYGYGNFVGMMENSASQVPIDLIPKLS
jgi:hypothetical protein